MQSTITFVSCLLPHSLASTFWNHWSYSGRKWAHFAIFSVFWLASARSGKTKNGPNAAEPAASLRKSRREVLLSVFLLILAAVRLRDYHPTELFLKADVFRNVSPRKTRPR